VVTFHCERSSRQTNTGSISRLRAGLEQLLTLGAHARSRINIPDVNGDLLFAFPDVVAHGRKLHLQRLLLVRGHSRNRGRLAALPPWPKTPCGRGCGNPDFAGVRRCDLVMAINYSLWS